MNNEMQNWPYVGSIIILKLLTPNSSLLTDLKHRLNRSHSSYAGLRFPLPLLLYLNPGGLSSLFAGEENNFICYRKVTNLIHQSKIWY